MNKHRISSELLATLLWMFYSGFYFSDIKKPRRQSITFFENSLSSEFVDLLMEFKSELTKLIQSASVRDAIVAYSNN